MIESLKSDFDQVALLVMDRP